MKTDKKINVVISCHIFIRGLQHHLAAISGDSRHRTRPVDQGVTISPYRILCSVLLGTADNVIWPVLSFQLDAHLGEVKEITSYLQCIEGAKIWRKKQLSPSWMHWCMVVYISVPHQQNIFFSWMKRPSDDSSRRIIPVQFWEVLYTYKYFFLKYFLFYFFFFYFTIFLNFWKLCY